MIKLLIFDAGDLLWEPLSTRLTKLYRRFEQKWHITSRQHDAAWQEVAPLAQNGRLGLLEAQKRYFYKLGLPQSAALEWHNLDKKIVATLCRCKPAVRTTLPKLKRLGYKLAILSDSVQYERILRRRMQTLGIEKYFDSVFSSCEIRHVKPEPAAYRTVMRHFNVRPNETVFVGHAVDELDGAARLGIRTIAIDGDRGASADFCSKRFSAIPALIKSLK